MCSHDKCNSTTGCYNVAYNLSAGGECDDFNDCTIDSCDKVTGCAHVNRTCPNPYNDSCIVNFCDVIYGCKSEPMGCITNDTCFVGYCDSQQGAICINEELESCKVAKVAIAATVAVLGIGAIVGIIVAAVVCAGLSAAGAVAGYNLVYKGEFAHKNPLFQAETQTGSNPAYGRNSVFNQKPLSSNN